MEALSSGNEREEVLKQALGDLEQRYLTLKKEYDSLLSQQDFERANALKMSTLVEEQTEKILNAEKQVADYQIEFKHRDIQIRDLTHSRDDYADRFRRKSDECGRLREDLTAQSSELLSLQQRLRDSMLRVSEIESSQLPNELEHVKLTHERDRLQDRLRALEEDITIRAREDRDFRVESSRKIRELESELGISQAAEKDAKTQVKMAKDQLKSQNEKVDAYMKQISDLQASEISQQDNHNREIINLQRLAELYKGHLDDATSRLKEIEGELKLLQESSNVKIANFKEKIILQAQESEQLKASKSILEEKVNELEGQVEVLQAQVEKSKTETSSRKVATIDPESSTSEELMKAIANSDGLGIAELFDKLVQAERELLLEKGRRLEAEAYMQQVLKDVERKAPIIASQKRDYMRIVESHEQISARLDAALADNKSLRDNSNSLQTRAQQAVEEASALLQHNSDLSSQLQHLLRKSLNAPDSSSKKPLLLMNSPGAQSRDSSGVISDYLVKFDNIEELQARNAQLLQIVRKLSEEQEKWASSSSMDIVQTSSGTPTRRASEEQLTATSSALQSALSELQEMRAARQRTEDMVVGLVQQRDMYRAMVEVSPQVTVASTANQNEELRQELQAEKEEKRRLADRIQRMQDGEKILREALDKLQQESTTLRLTAAHAKSESSASAERLTRLEDDLRLSQVDAQSSLARRMELEKTLQELQRVVREKELANGQVNDALRSALDAKQKAEMDREIAVSAESRANAQLFDCREEIKRNSQLMEHLHRIESGLKSRAESEKEQAINEKDEIAKSCELLRRQMDDKVMLLEQRLLAQDEELRALRSQSDQRLAEVATLKEHLTREHCSSVSAQERANLLERQLTIAQERLSSAQGGVLIESLYEKDLAEKSAALVRTTAELALVKEQLAAADSHVQQFRSISIATETTLNQLRKAFAEAKASSDEQVSRLERELSQAQGELAQRRQEASDLLKECEEARETMRAQVQNFNEQRRALQGELELSQQEVQDAKAQLSAIHADATRFQLTAKQAFANYERELQLHAAAERALKESQETADSLRTSLSSAEHRAASLSTDLIRLERNVEDEKKRAVAETSSLKELLAELTRTNELLHSQVQTYGSQIDRMRDNRILSAASADNLDPSTISSSSSSTSLAALAAAAVKAAEGAAGTAADTAVSSLSAEEVNELKKSLIELREVLRYMKKEKDMLLAKQSVLDSENNRHIIEISRISKQLDEAKALLKRELENRQTAARSDEEFARLLSEVGQLNLVRESNAHLRNDNEELYKKLQNANEEARSLKEAAAPLHNEIRRLKAEKDSLDLLNDQLMNDVGYWKDRLQNIVSKYNDVDPEEHRLLKLKLEEQSAAATQAAAGFAQHVTDLETKFKETFDELAAAKTRSTELDNQNNSLRMKLRNFIEARRTSDANAAAEIARLNAANEALSQQLAAVEADVKKITASNEMLTRQLDGTRKALTLAKQANAASANAVAAAVAVAPAAPIVQATPLTIAASVPVPAVEIPVPTPVPVPVPVVSVAASAAVLADNVESSATSVASSDSASDLTQQMQAVVSKKRDRTAQESTDTPAVLATDIAVTSKPAPPAGPPPAQAVATEITPEMKEAMRKKLAEKKATLTAAAPVAVETSTTAAVVPAVAARPIQSGPAPKRGRVILGQPQIPKQGEAPLLAPGTTECGDMEVVAVSTEEQSVLESNVGETIADVPQPAKSISAPAESALVQQQPQQAAPLAQLQPFSQLQSQRQQPPTDQQAAIKAHPFVVSGGTGSSVPYGKGLNPFSSVFTPQAASAPPPIVEEGEMGFEENSNPPRPQVALSKTTPFFTTQAPGIAAVSAPPVPLLNVFGKPIPPAAVDPNPTVDAEGGGAHPVEATAVDSVSESQSSVRVLVASSNISEAERIANRGKRFESPPVQATATAAAARGVPRQPKVNSAMLQKSLQSSVSTSSLQPPPPPPQQQQQQPAVVVAATSEVHEPVVAIDEWLDNAPPGPFSQTQEPIEQELEEGEEPTVE